MAKTIYDPALEIVFLSSLKDRPRLSDPFCTVKTISGREPSLPQLIDLASIGEILALVEYEGTQNIQHTIKDITYSVRTAVWERTIKLATKDMNGADAALVSSLATQVKAQQDAAFFAALIANAATYDGTALLASSRSGDFAAINNIVSATGTDIDYLAADLDSAINLLYDMKSANGTQVNVDDSGLVILTPVELRGKFKQLVAAETIAATTNNYFGGLGIEVVASPLLTTANDWYLMKLDDPDRRPFVRVDVAEPTVAPVEPSPTNNLDIAGIQAWANYAFAPYDFMKIIGVGI